MGGSQTTTTDFPPWITGPAKSAIKRGEEVGKIGYVPYYGPDVAAFTPAQNAAFRNTNQAAGAFGMDRAKNPMPKAEKFKGGIQGYSSGGLFDQAISEVFRANPGQHGLLSSFFYDTQSDSYRKKGKK